MIYGFYFRFYKMTKNRMVSVILSKLAYFVFLIRFTAKRLLLKNHTVIMDKDEAISIIDSIYSDPGVRPVYQNHPIDPDVDLSIIIPVYNYADLIRKNIESVLNQKTKYRFELILVDDGSTDGARDIVLQYQEKTNVTVILQENQGIAGARNTGIDHACGRYLMFIDCDDTVHDNLVEIMMNEAYANDRDIVMCAHNLSKEANGEIYSIIPNIYPQKNLHNYKNGDEIMNYAGLPWAKVYKRELWNQVRFFPGYWFEDSIIHFLIFTQCRSFSYIPEVCYEYRWYEKNFSHIQGKITNVKNLDRYWLVIAMIEQYQKMGMPLDAEFYTVLLKHLSAHYYPSFEGMDDKVIEAMFTLACDLLDEYIVEDCRLPYVLKVTEKAMRNRDIELWKLSCRYQ